jgi:leader peptidase (prepilin peptidase)/N-methyltransferase
MSARSAEPNHPSLFASLALSPPKAVVALAIGAVGSIAAVTLMPASLASPGVLLAFALAWAAVVDADRFILPDAITLGLVLAGLGLHMTHDEPLLDFVIGAATGYLVLALVAGTYQRLRGRAGLGMGDAKLMAAAGAWLGWAALPLVMLGASLAALVWAGFFIARHGRAGFAAPIPFGPFIAAAFFANYALPM